MRALAIMIVTASACRANGGATTQDLGATNCSWMYPPGIWQDCDHDCVDYRFEFIFSCYCDQSQHTGICCGTNGSGYGCGVASEGMLCCPGKPGFASASVEPYPCLTSEGQLCDCGKDYRFHCTWLDLGTPDLRTPNDIATVDGGSPD